MSKDVSDIEALVGLYREGESREKERERDAKKALEEEAALKAGALATARNSKGHYLPGFSGNPLGANSVREGRAKSLAKVLSEASDGGLEFVHRMLSFARGEVEGLTPKECFEVNKYLFERLAGKTPDTVLVADVSAHPALDALTVEELRRFAQGQDDDS